MMREGMLECQRKFGPSAPTALTTHGANPGMVSHFVKQALVNIAKRDTQVREKPKEVGEFVNTWSIDGFISEGC